MCAGVHAEDIAAKHLNPITRSELPHSQVLQQISTMIGKASYSLTCTRGTFSGNMICSWFQEANSAFPWSLSIIQQPFTVQPE